MMRLLADENFPGEAVEALRVAGYDVLWIAEDAPSIDDQDVLARAVREQRLLLTFDKDFGELVFRLRYPAGNGVVLFRIPPYDPEYVAQFAVVLLAMNIIWIGYFSVVDGNRIRRVPLPPALNGNHL